MFEQKQELNKNKSEQKQDLMLGMVLFEQKLIYLVMENYSTLRHFERKEENQSLSFRSPTQSYRICK